MTKNKEHQSSPSTPIPSKRLRLCSALFCRCSVVFRSYYQSRNNSFKFSLTILFLGKKNRCDVNVVVLFLTVNKMEIKPVPFALTQYPRKQMPISTWPASCVCPLINFRFHRLSCGLQIYGEKKLIIIYISVVDYKSATKQKKH